MNEKEVGEVFQDFIGKKIPREDLFIVGKLWGTDHHPDDVEPACRQSLADLKIDYFDAYLIHWPTSFVVIFGRHKPLIPIPFRICRIDIHSLALYFQAKIWPPQTIYPF